MSPQIRCEMHLGLSFPIMKQCIQTKFGLVPIPPARKKRVPLEKKLNQLSDYYWNHDYEKVYVNLNEYDSETESFIENDLFPSANHKINVAWIRKYLYIRPLGFTRSSIDLALLMFEKCQIAPNEILPFLRRENMMESISL